ncbi:unnamed protein product [Symbiodinium sp. CCMP2592]|nr:unnamed protein product [Symbiodinium sp. CCMP2592]
MRLISARESAVEATFCNVGRSDDALKRLPAAEEENIRDLPSPNRATRGPPQNGSQKTEERPGKVWHTQKCRERYAEFVRKSFDPSRTILDQAKKKKQDVGISVKVSMMISAWSCPTILIRFRIFHWMRIWLITSRACPESRTRWGRKMSQLLWSHRAQASLILCKWKQNLLKPSQWESETLLCRV